MGFKYLCCGNNTTTPCFPEHKDKETSLCPQEAYSWVVQKWRRKKEQGRRLVLHIFKGNLLEFLFAHFRKVLFAFHLSVCLVSQHGKEKKGEQEDIGRTLFSETSWDFPNLLVIGIVVSKYIPSNPSISPTPWDHS